MVATVIENLSNRKLLITLTTLFIILILTFYIGAFLTPSPSSYEQFTAINCQRKNKEALAIPRHQINTPRNCDQKPLYSSDTTEVTTFAVQLPLPRDRVELDYSRWMQTLLVILVPEFQNDPLFYHDDHSTHKSHSNLNFEYPLRIDVKLAVRNKEDKEWQIYADRKGLKRTLKCHSNDADHGSRLDCAFIQLFDLQSLYYDYYLINFELNLEGNINLTHQKFAKLVEVTGVAIHQNGGFARIWMFFKVLYFVSTLTTLTWYCNRLRTLNRKTILIERVLICLGSSLTQLNAPLELLNLYYDITYMTFLNDLRQGIFYFILFTFWIIFVGEHLTDTTRKESRILNYYKEMLAICTGSMFLLIFDLCERGTQASDPFTSIWETEPLLAKLSIYIALIASISYLAFLFYYIYLAYLSISGKESSFPKMQITKRLKYQGIIFRFKFLLCATFVCALSTFVFYVISQKSEYSQDDELSTSQSQIEWTSAMLITVNCMWNLYVMFLLILYAPSHKGLTNGIQSDQIEFDCLTEEKNDYDEQDMKILQDFATKASFD